MRLRASLRLRPEHLEASSGKAQAANYLMGHGINVLRIGRTAVSVEAYSAALARITRCPVPEDATRLQIAIDPKMSDAGAWFDLLEVVPPPTLMNQAGGGR